MLTRASFVLLLALAVMQAPVAAQDQTLQVVPLPRDGQVLVSFKLQQPLTDEIRTAIHSGLTVSFIYKVDLKRSSPLWIDRTVASATVTASVRYDNLTRRYSVTRMLDGRMDWAETIDREETVWSSLTTDFARLPLFRGIALEANGEYYVRVRAHSTPRNASFIWPWQGDDVVGLAKFTFIR